MKTDLFRFIFLPIDLILLFSQVEKVGYFPAAAVTLISNQKKASSSGSISSSSDSSLNSATSGISFCFL